MTSRRFALASCLAVAAVSSFAFAGCAVQSDSGDDTESSATTDTPKSIDTTARVSLCTPNVAGPGAQTIEWAVCDLPFTWESVRTAVDAGGNTYVTGDPLACTANGCVVLMKLDPAGKVAWQLDATAAASGDESQPQPANVRLDASGNVWLGLSVVGSTTIGDVTVEAQSADTPRRVLLAQIDADGTVAQTHVVPDGNGSSYMVDFAANDAGFAVLTAQLDGHIGDEFVVQVDQAGYVAWSQHIPAAVDQQGAFTRILSTPAGGVVVSGWLVQLDFGGRDFGTGTVFASFDGTGHLAWTRGFANSSSPTFTLASDGGVVIPSSFDAPAPAGTTLLTLDLATGDTSTSVPLPSDFTASGELTFDPSGGLLFGDADSDVMGADSGALVVRSSSAGDVTWSTFLTNVTVQSVAAGPATSVVAGLVEGRSHVERCFVAKLAPQ